MENEVKNVMEAIDNLKKGLLTKEAVETMIAEKTKDLNKTEIEALKSELQAQTDKLGTEITAMKEKGTEVISFSKFLEKNKEIIKAIQDGKEDAELNIPIKMLGLTQKTTVIPSAISSDPTRLLLNEIGQIAYQQPRIVNILPSIPYPSGMGRSVTYIDWTTATRAAAARTIGNAASESTAAWTTYSKPMESVSDILPVALEMLNNWSWMEAELQMFLRTNLMLKENSYLLNGTGTPPQISGLNTYATAFDAAAYVAAGKYKPVNCTIADFIRVLSRQISIGTNYTPDFCVINPDDAAQLDMAKNSTNDYIRIPFVVYNPDGTFRIGAIRVIEDADQTINTLVIGDSKYAKRYYGENLTLSRGYNKDGDFGKRIISILANMEEMLLVRTCEAGAFLKSTSISSDISTITA